MSGVAGNAHATLRRNDFGRVAGQRARNCMITPGWVVGERVQNCMIITRVARRVAAKTC
jgi:hypothetical protein